MFKSKLLFYSLIICFLFNFSLNLFSTEIKISKKLYGFTIDDSWYDEVKIEDIIEGIKNLPEKTLLFVLLCPRI